MDGAAWWVPLLAAVIGGVLVIISNIGLEIFKRNREAKSLALAIRGEMIAVIEIVRLRNYVALLSQAVRQLSAGRTVTMPPIRIDREYFPIYAENASRIGILSPNVAACVARAYTYANSFMEDATRQRNPILPPGAQSLVQETLDVLNHALKEANAAVDLIERRYLRKCWEEI